MTSEYNPLLRTTAWRDDDGDTWAVTMELAKVNGRIEAVAITVKPTGTPRGITTKAMRSIPYRTLINTEVNRAVGRLKRESGDHRTPQQVAKDVRKGTKAMLKGITLSEPLPDPKSLPDDAPIAERAALLARIMEGERPRRGAPAKYGMDQWAKVAAVYEEAHLTGSPTRAVATAFSISHGKAANWVRRCRELGLLRPAEEYGMDFPTTTKNDDGGN